MDTTKTFHKGSTFGAILLVAGCCIGGGMLGLPVVSAPAGFIPSTVAMFVCCFFMITTGLLVLEANLWFKRDVNLISMAGHTLGKTGQAITWFLFLFLFYCLFVAYTSGSGELIAGFLTAFFNYPIPDFVGSLITATTLGFLAYLGTRTVDTLNRVFIFGLAIAYCLLIVLGATHIHPEALLVHHWKAALGTLPIMLISFGYHNLIPSLSTYLGGNVRKMRKAIIVGAMIPLFLYLLWQAVILGMLPYENKEKLQALANHSDMVTNLLSSASQSPLVLIFINLFAFFAIVTSFITNALSCIDFLFDGFDLKRTRQNRAFLCLLAIVPPLIFALFYPHLFINALNFAGGFATVIVFGILPAAMVWVGRYHMQLEQHALVGGGRLTLIAIIAFSLFVFAIELNHQLNLF